MVTAERTKDEAIERRVEIEELTEIIDEFLKSSYGLNLNIPIKRNNRLSRAMGRYLATWDDVPVNIDIAGFMFDHGTREVIIDTAKHEATHYALHVLGKPNSDGDEYFENELRKNGVTSTGTNIVGLHYVGKCQECGNNTYGKNKRIALPSQRFTSKCCKAPVEYVGERIYDGTEVVN